MERLAPLGPVYQAGTLSGNPVAMAAGLATLRAADDAVYATLDANADRLAGLLAEALTNAGVPHQIPRAGNMLSVFFSETPVTDFASARASQTWRYAAVLSRAAGRRRLPAVQRRSRRGSSRPRWTTTAFERIAEALPLRPAAAAAAQAREILMAEHTRVHVVRHGEVYNPERRPLRPAARILTSPTRAKRKRQRWPTRWPSATSSR